MSRARRGALALLLAAGILSACTPSVGTRPTTPAPSQSEEPSTTGVVIDDPWIEATDETMAGAFGEIRNETSRDLHAVSASSPLTDRVELHETLSQGSTAVMSEMPDGFLVPAGGTYTLEPGGAHVMLLALTEPIEAGDDVEITLHFDDGSSVTWQAPVRIE